MKTKAAKIVLRAIGTLIALQGLAVLCSALFLLTFSVREHNWVLLPVLLLLLPLAIWFVYIGYLVWTQYSPLVVRQVCGAIALLCFQTMPGHMTTHTRADFDSPWIAPAFIGLILVTWAVYRVISKRLNRWLFPEFG